MTFVIRKIDIKSKVIEEIFEAIQFGESSLTLKQVQDNHQIH